MKDSISFDAKIRDDGSMFVTSPNIPAFSAVVDTGDWPAAFVLLIEFFRVNAEAKERKA